MTARRPLTPWHFFPPAHWWAAVAAVVTVELALTGECTAQETVTPEARAHFEEGVRQLRGQDPNRHQNAYREFKAAYALSPSWKILGNLGIAAQQLERDGEAIDAFEEYLRQGKAELSAREREQVERDLARLQTEAATITIEGPPGPLWIVDTRVPAGGPSIVNEYGPFDGRTTLRVRAGTHNVRIKSGGIEAPPWSVILLPGDKATHALEAPQEAAPQPRPSESNATPAGARPRAKSHTAAYVLWGTGAAAAIGSAVVYLRAESIQSSANEKFDRDCGGRVVAGDPRCMPTTPEDRKAAAWRTAALVTGGVALGALITGTALYLLDGRPATTEAGARPGHSEDDSVQVCVGPGGLGVRGSF